MTVTTDKLTEQTPTHLMRRIQRVHFVGIGGVGMSGIAEVMLNLGYQVSGSDLASNVITKRLQHQGAVIYQGHEAANVSEADVVVVSTAVSTNNPEVKAAIKNRIPVVPRAEMLAEIMRFRQGIAVAGTHGKTTTTSLVASLLAEGGLDPTFVIGGKLNSVASHGQLGTGQYLVAEADESDASFLYLQPIIAIVTNIDSDHLSTYEGDFQKLQEAFNEFLHHLPFYGLAVLCIEDPVVSELLPKIKRPILTYGFDQSADISATDIKIENGNSIFDVQLPDRTAVFKAKIRLPGRHNVLNALAAIAVAQELGVSVEAMQRGLEKFSGIARRFQRYGAVMTPHGEIELVDDYAHHPTEIQATIDAARESWPNRRLVLAFQPHRYTRTRDLLDDFAEVLSTVDLLCLCDVYPAGEKVITGADGRALSKAIRVRGKVDPVFIKDVQQLSSVLQPLLMANDVLLTLGAGNIGAVATTLADDLRSSKE